MAGSLQAKQKALALFRSWLSPGQFQQYNFHKHFEVIGSDTGTRYRIRHGRMMNIDELDSVGNKVCEWCFLPAGNLAVGDVMLAQKIALEIYESGALAVANRGCAWAPRGAAASRGYPIQSRDCPDRWGSPSRLSLLLAPVQSGVRRR